MPPKAPHGPSALALTRVRLENFKAAHKPKAIAVGAFTAIIGRNGSGKSTLLEALQWVDTALRRDAVAACDRYAGIHDLCNLRSQATPPYFALEFLFGGGRNGLRYSLRVREDQDGTTPVVEDECLSTGRGQSRTVLVDAPLATDRLGLSQASATETHGVRDFWKRAVFLRLNPSSLSQGSPPRRTSTQPLLDEQGEMLPALLGDLTEDQRAEVARGLSEMLSGIRGVALSKPAAHRSERIHYELIEEMPYRGRSGQKQFRIPAWMLSEGTRRLTALLALLARTPPPSLLCIEELENGLDPWCVRSVVDRLKLAATTGTQVIVTTHSPWVLDMLALDEIVRVRRIKGNSVYERFGDLAEVRAFADGIPPGTRFTQLENG